MRREKPNLATYCTTYGFAAARQAREADRESAAAIAVGEKHSLLSNEIIPEATTLCRKDFEPPATGATQVGKIRSPEQERSPLRDRNARESFVRESHEELFRWFYRLVGSPDEAADLTQDTFLAFWNSLDRRPESVSPRTWLFAIGRNLWRGRLRDRKSFEPTLLALVADARPSPETTFLEREFREAVNEAVAELPDDLREVFTLRFWNELAYEEIGQIQGVSADLARWRYFAARKRLHGRLESWNPELEQGKEDRHAR